MMKNSTGGRAVRGKIKLKMIGLVSRQIITAANAMTNTFTLRST